MNRNFDWNTAVRWAAGLSALFLWGLSIGWSGDGFTKLGSGVSPDKAWLGIALGFVFTIIQLVWNRMRGGSGDNLTIWVIGLMIYAYSLITDFFGITDWFGFSRAVNFESAFGAFMSLLVEVLPEPLILWSITGSFTGGDFLSNIFGRGREETSSYSYPKNGRTFPKENSHPSMGYNTQPPMAKKNNTRDLISKRVSRRDLRPAMPLRNLNEPRRDEEDDEEDMPTFLKSNRR